MKNRAVAEYFVQFANKCGDSITHLKLQKLVYYAQAWHIALNDHQPLFEENRAFQAWQHGPVNYDLYTVYADYKWTPINREPNTKLINEHLSENDKEFLNDVADVYFQFEAYKLEVMTHQEDPWIEARDGLPEDAPSQAIINEDTMYSFYKKLSESDE
ncbi:MAG: DUF4065 domain-containing protein [Sulfurimonas sp.]|jgi:uncharacterized phage-associated protein|nr:DUF4065 domain-containing protein [Sulfurimonas sp.]